MDGTNSVEQVIVAGHSHLSALGVPMNTALGEFRAVALPSSTLKMAALTGPWTGSWPQAYWDTLVNRSKDKTVVLIWNGNQHNAQFLLAPARPFDVYLAARPELGVEPGVEIVPKALIEQSNEYSLRALPTLIENLRRSAAKRVIVLGTPAPKSDLTSLLHVVSQSEFWRKQALSSGIDPDSPTITDGRLRLKLWKILQEATEHIAIGADAEFLPVPPESLNDEGFLREKYWAQDLTHANFSYGSLVLQYLSKYLSV